MKIAVTGKGGTGKTTISSMLAHYFNDQGYKVLAVDADPDANLAFAVGLTEKESSSLTPISEQRILIKERTGAKPMQFGQLFKLNPKVDDIPDTFCTDFNGIKLLIMGAVRKGGGGCACPENVLLRSLLSEIILHRHEAVIVDMEAGIEHLGRGTGRSLDIMLIVVEPGRMSLGTARTIIKLAGDIGIHSYGIVGNKIRNDEDIRMISDNFPSNRIMGMISWEDRIREAEYHRRPISYRLNRKCHSELEILYKNLHKIPLSYK